MRRIVVTGMGAVSPLGANVTISWSRLLAGQSGIRRLGDDVVGNLPSKIGGVVPSFVEDPEGGFDPDRVMTPKDHRKIIDRFVLFALAAAEEALTQARWKPISDEDRLRTATIIASGISGFPAITESVRTVNQRGARLSPFPVPSFLINLAAGQSSTRFGFKGHVGAPVTASAAGVQAIGDAARLIRSNEADIALCGGTEACMNTVSLGGFAATKTLSTGFNETPSRASRPFDMMRDGFVVGEGAGILVIEALSHALARGATPIAELVGYGSATDAHHINNSPEGGNGAHRAMEIAIAQAGLAPHEIGHLNAHAISIPVGDLAEIRAIKRVFGSDNTVTVSGTKSATGHLLDAAGGLEAIFAILALKDQIAPPTINLNAPDPEADGIDFVANEARHLNTEYAISNGFGVQVSMPAHSSGAGQRQAPAAQRSVDASSRTHNIMEQHRCQES